MPSMDQLGGLLVVLGLGILAWILGHKHNRNTDSQDH